MSLRFFFHERKYRGELAWLCKSDPTHMEYVSEKNEDENLIHDLRSIDSTEALCNILTFSKSQVWSISFLLKVFIDKFNS